MSSHDTLGQALVGFSSRGTFPDDETVSATAVDASNLSSALLALQRAKEELEEDIRQTSHDSAVHVDEWIVNAKSLQEEIEASRKLAVDIVQQAAADEHREEIIRQREIYEDFLTREVSFNAQLLAALVLVADIHGRLDKAEQLIEERRILDGLRALEDVWGLMTDMTLDQSTRAVRMLEERSYELKATAHSHLDTLWRSLVVVDDSNKSLTINGSLAGAPGTLAEAVVALQAYKELDKAAIKLARSLSQMMLTPRVHPPYTELVITPNSIALGHHSAQPNLESLFQDLQTIILFLKEALPKPFANAVAKELMADLVVQIKEAWLDHAVPASLDYMDNYTTCLEQVRSFSDALKTLEWPGADTFDDWVHSAPKIWLNKRREDALDQVRNGLSGGVRSPKRAQKVETRTVHNHELPVAEQDWGAWGSDNENDGVAENSQFNNGSGVDHDMQESSIAASQTKPRESLASEGDDDDAWGWNDDEDIIVEEPLGQKNHPSKHTAQLDQANVPVNNKHSTRQVTMSEDYWTSGLPQPIMDIIKEIYEDGAKLLQPENSTLPVAPVAAQLFAIPTLVLALYRAVGPLFYNSHDTGNLYIYNDTLWLADGLRQFVDEWRERPNLPARAAPLVRLDNEITVLESFGKRAYTHELNAQRIVLKDLLGGTHNFLQDEGVDRHELIGRSETVVKHIRSRAQAWENILSPSALTSTIGTLVNSVAIRLINDIFDMSSMSVTEAETAAMVISTIEKLDDLFLPKSTGASNALSSSDQAIPLTSQYADQWMKMKFLSQTLQSNLTDINFLWFESDLSLYFTAQEVIELIELSFENNPGVRSQIRQIRESPHPRSVD